MKHIIDTFAGGDSARFKNMKLRLSNPVFPGETVRTEMWSEDDGKRIVYRQLAGNDKVVISQAAVELAAEKKATFVDRNMLREKAKM